MKRVASFTRAWWSGRQVLLALALAGVVAATGCRARALPADVQPAATPAPPTSSPSSPPFVGKSSTATQADSAPRTLQRCFPDAPTWVDAPIAQLLDRAADTFEAGDFATALACAEEAARQAPRSVEAHHNRAVALIRLERLDEARDTLALALALDPDDPETLEAAADFNINQLPPTADRSAIGLEYARRGGRRAARRDPQRGVRLALLEGQALIDLGRAQEALRRIDAALVIAPRSPAAQYERGVALFELCRFAEARRMFGKVLVEAPQHGHARYHLGLIDERLGDEAAAQRNLAEAGTQDPKTFPTPPDVSASAFSALVQRALAELPDDVRADLKGITVEAADLPRLEDLVAEQPPLSPTILGLFRGLPLGWSGDLQPSVPQPTRAGKGRRAALAAPSAEISPAACAVPDRAIVLYRRNLLRTVRDENELAQAITRTLMHEVGHLRGEDDGSLRDRGLE